MEVETFFFSLGEFGKIMSNIPGRLCGHHRHLSFYFWSLSPVSAFSSPWPLPGVEASPSHASLPASQPANCLPGGLLSAFWLQALGSLPSQGCLSVTGYATLVPTPFPGSPRPILSLPEEGLGTSQPLPASCQSSWPSVHPQPPSLLALPLLRTLAPRTCPFSQASPPHSPQSVCLPPPFSSDLTLPA